MMTEVMVMVRVVVAVVMTPGNLWRCGTGGTPLPRQVMPAF